MSQYSVGLASTTSGSAVVTFGNDISGNVPNLTGNVSAGDELRIGSDSVYYIVGSVDSSTQLTLTSNYTATLEDVAYEIIRDFTSNRSYPKPNQGDLHFADLMARALSKIDTDMASFSATLNPELAAIKDLTGTTGLLKRTGTATYSHVAITANGQSLITAADYAAMLTLLGIGTMGTQNANAVNITGGTGAFSDVTATGKVEARTASGKDGIKITGTAVGTGGYTINLQPDSLSANRTITFPNASGEVLLTNIGQDATLSALTVDELTVQAGGVYMTQGGAKDAINIYGRNGGTSNFQVNLTNLALTDDRTLSLPDASGTLATLDDVPTPVTVYQLAASTPVTSGQMNGSVFYSGSLIGAEEKVVLPSATTTGLIGTFCAPSSTSVVLSPAASEEIWLYDGTVIGSSGSYDNIQIDGESSALIFSDGSVMHMFLLHGTLTGVNDP